MARLPAVSVELPRGECSQRCYAAIDRKKRVAGPGATGREVEPTPIPRPVPVEIEHAEHRVGIEFGAEVLGVPIGRRHEVDGINSAGKTHRVPQFMDRDANEIVCPRRDPIGAIKIPGVVAAQTDRRVADSIIRRENTDRGKSQGLRVAPRYFEDGVVGGAVGVDLQSAVGFLVGEKREAVSHR